jgi:hypothetical protein
MAEGREDLAECDLNRTAMDRYVTDILRRYMATFGTAH